MNMTFKTAVLALCSTLISLAAAAQFDSKTKTLDISAYINKYGTPNDISPAVVKALADCKRLGAKKLVFPKNTYKFRPDSLKKFMSYVSNHGDYVRCFAFDLTGQENLVIDGQGSQFLFKGYVCPFYVNHAKGITLQDFSVDFERTFHSEGHILEVTEDYADVEFGKEYPYYVDEKKHLRCVDDEGVEYPWYYLLEFDPQRQETAYDRGDQWTGMNIECEDLGNGRVRLNRKGLKGTPGNVYSFGIAYRKVPGITIADSRDVNIQRVTLYHAGGMGVIAQRSANLLIDGLQIVPAPGKDRVVSVAADATHFVNCSGYLRMYNCTLRNQTDDATNIHGVYYRIADVLTDNRIFVELANDAQYGFDYLKPGLKLEFVNAQSLVTYAYGSVKSVYAVNDRKFMVTLSGAIPDSVKAGDAIAGCSEYPDVHIKGCYFGQNRARGLLLGSRSRMLLEENTFHTPGAAILMEGDARGWFEQGGVRNVIIRNNTFDNCSYANGRWDNGVICCGSGIDQKYWPVSYYNRNVLVENNKFIIHRAPLVRLYSVDGFTWRNNTVQTDDTKYPCQVDKANLDALMQFWSCKNVNCDPIELK